MTAKGYLLLAALYWEGKICRFPNSNIVDFP